MKNDYDNTPQKKWITRTWESIKDWLVNLLAKSEVGSLITGLVIAIIVTGCIVGLAKLSERHNVALEKQWTVQDSTFVEKQDGMYIYRRTIDGHQMYLMTDHLGVKQFVHSPNCDCDTIQYVP